MSKRYNVTVPRKYQSGGQEKTQWLKIGVAFESDKGGFDLQLDSMPLPVQDQKNPGQSIIRMKAFPADEKGGDAGRGEGRDKYGVKTAATFPDEDYAATSDEIPF